MESRRIFLDLTYTRVQQDTVGIVRTVRRLAEEFPAIARDAGIRFSSVACDGRGFRLAGVLASEGTSSNVRGLLGVATGLAKPAVEQLLRLPWPLIRPLWEHSAGRAFRATVAGFPAVQFRAGDRLLLFDAGWNYPVWRAAQRARTQGATVVPLIHDLMPLQAPQFCVPWVRSAFAHWLEQAVACSDAILCNSASTEDALRTHAVQMRWTLPPTSHISLGSDLPSTSSGLVRQELKAFLEPLPRCYATVGSLEPKKNHGVLLDAFESLWGQGETFGLLVVGRRTPQCEDIAQRLAQLAARGRPVLSLYDASDAEIAEIYRRAHALILPSLFEGFGLPLVEARTQGCSVLASDIPAFRELADSGVRLFDPRLPRELADLVLSHSKGELMLSTEPMAAVRWRDSAQQCLDQLQLLSSQGQGTALRSCS